jgi:hypothetical protein
MIGPLGMLDGYFQWLANPLLLFVWFQLGKKHWLPAAFLGSVAVALMLSLIVRGEILLDEGGHYSRIDSYNLGYWLWVMSALLPTLAALFNLRRQRNAIRQ